MLLSSAYSTDPKIQYFIFFRHSLIFMICMYNCCNTLPKKNLNYFECCILLLCTRNKLTGILYAGICPYVDTYLAASTKPGSDRIVDRKKCEGF